MKLAAAAYPIDGLSRWNEYVGKLRVWVRTAAEAGAQVLVFPEFAALELAGLAGEENARDRGRAVEALTARIKDVDELHSSLAREFGAHILAASGPLRTRDGVFNRARLFAPDGARGAVDQVAPDAAVRDAWGLGPGAPCVYETEIGRIGTLIGVDLAAPGLAAAMAAAGAVLLLAPGRAASSEAALVQREAAAAAARDTGCVIVQAAALGEEAEAPALGRSTGAAGVYAAAAPEGVLALGEADAAGWVHADAPAASVAPAAQPGRWNVEVRPLEARPAD